MTAGRQQHHRPLNEQMAEMGRVRMPFRNRVALHEEFHDLTKILGARAHHYIKIACTSQSYFAHLHLRSLQRVVSGLPYLRSRWDDAILIDVGVIEGGGEAPNRSDALRTRGILAQIRGSQCGSRLPTPEPPMM